MAKYSTLRVGGPAKAVVFPKHREELAQLFAGLHTFEIAWRVIGRGSNILVSDEGFDGVIIVLGNEFSDINMITETENFVAVNVEAGCSLPRLVSWCANQGYGGLEFAGGIPGTVGGGVLMNAGAWGQEMADVVTSVTFMDSTGQLHVFERESLRFGYRKLETDKEMIVVSAIFSLSKARKEDVATECKRISKLRREKQPLGEASAGSFFKNPGKVAAGKLIDEAGLKGYRIGGAMVSDKHANFIINTGTATSSDILALMEHVQNTVFEKSGIMLEPEVHLISSPN